MIFIFLLYLLITFFTILFSIHLIQEMTSRAFFVPLPKNVLDKIISKIDFKDGGKIYDLGSGDGRFVFSVSKKNKKIKVVGIERSLLPYLISIFLLEFGDYENVKILRKNFFDCNLKDATHVFVYLSPSLMDMLLPKFKSELPKGAKVISCDFIFSEKEKFMLFIEL